MLKDLVVRFVADELMPLEAATLAREAAGQSIDLPAGDRARVDARSRDLGLWGLDAPADVGGSDMPAVAMVAVNEELGQTITPYTIPPDSPNLRMLATTVTDRHRPPARSVSRTLRARRDDLGDRHLGARGRLRSCGDADPRRVRR